MGGFAHLSNLRIGTGLVTAKYRTGYSGRDLYVCEGKAWPLAKQ